MKIKDIIKILESRLLVLNILIKDAGWDIFEQEQMKQRYGSVAEVTRLIEIFKKEEAK